MHKKTGKSDLSETLVSPACDFGQMFIVCLLSPIILRTPALPPLLSPLGPWPGSGTVAESSFFSDSSPIGFVLFDFPDVPP